MFEKYVESPVDCKIFLKYNSSEGKELKEVLLTQALNYRITENKKPVYGFNRNRFGQVIKGKRLVEGVIVLKKSLFNEISDLIDLKLNSEEEESLKIVNDKIKYLKTSLVSDNRLKSLVAEYEVEAISYFENKIKALKKNQKYNIFNKMPNGTQLIVAFGSLLNSEEFKTEYKNIESSSETYVEELEKLINAESELVIEDINFIEKTGEINISKTDVDEVYKFFGSLDSWEE